jgi:hypothetical protein
VGCAPGGLGIDRLERQGRLKRQDVVKMMIDVFVSPTSTWHPPVPPPKPPQPPPGLNGTDLMLFKALQRHGRYGSLIWPLLNEVAAEQKPEDRAEARQIRLELWGRLRKLIKAGVVHWYTRKSISIHNLPRQYLGPRQDIEQHECVLSQLKFKAHEQEEIN